MPVITCIEDLKRLHKAHTPRMFYDYAESGSYTEQTFRENTTDFAQIRLRQKVAVDMTGRTLASDMVGLPVSMPVGLAPVGMTGMQRADGEIKAARAAEAFGVTYRRVPREDGDYTMDHTSGVLVFDPDGRLARIIDLHENPQAAVPKIRQALKQEG